jgi:hypothetical protein
MEFLIGSFAQPTDQTEVTDQRSKAEAKASEIVPRQRGSLARVLGLTEIVTRTALELLEGKLSELDQNYVTCTCSNVNHETG